MNMGKKQGYGKMVSLSMEIPEDLAMGLAFMAQVKNISEENLIRFWIEEALEREELRFERLLLFAEVTEDLDEEGIKLLQKLKNKYFDVTSDCQRGLDSYLVKSRNINHLY